jgi:signal transduction histidine kinase
MIRSMIPFRRPFRLRPIRRRGTLRARLTVLHGGLFFVAGALLLGVTYLLVAQRIDQRSDLDSALTPIVARRPEQLPGAGGGASQAGRAANAEQALRETIELARAQQRKLRDDAMNSLLTQGTLALGGVGVAAVGAGWLLTGRALRPLQRITETAQRIAADGAGRGLHERIALDGPRDEVKRLADTFDLMLERLDQAFEAQRRFVASASHEMRTPLAIKRALIEVAVTRPGATRDAKELGESLLEVNRRHERLVDGLLTLADSENEIAERHPVDLAEVAGHVLATASALAREAGVEIRATELGTARTAGDPYLLERVAQNLVENAIRHNQPGGGWVCVRTWSLGEQVNLHISNTGAVLRGYETEALFAPFRRRAEVRTAGERGFGLGLSIVRAVVRAHGGQVRAQARDGGGLEVTVTLPASQGDPHHF